MKVFDTVVENDDKYTWAELNCFFRPLAILFKSFNSDYFDILLLYASLYECFISEVTTNEYSNYTSNDINEEFINYYNNNIKDNLGVEIINETIEKENTLIDLIIKFINNDVRILIPIDLYELFYFTRYKEDHHFHNLIIKGYDDDKKVFYTLDNIHYDRGANTIYKDFVISYPILESTSYSWAENFTLEKKPLLWGIRKYKNLNSMSAIFKSLKFIYDFYERVENGVEKMTFLEYEYIKKIAELNENINNIHYDILYRFNFKKVYYDILSKLLKKVMKNDELLEQLEETKNNLLSEWDVIRMNLLYIINSESKEYTEILKKCELILIQEKKFRLLFLSIFKRIENSFNSNIIENNLYEIRNNYNAKIAHSNSYENVDITLSNTTIYDNWSFQDNAPQLLVNVLNLKGFEIECDLEVMNDQFKIFDSFQSGIIVKYDNGIKYMYGKCTKNMLSLYCPEEKNQYCIKEQTYLYEKIKLKVKKKDETITFYFKNAQTDNWNIFHKINQTLNKIERIGLYVRTWDKIDCVVSFSNIKINRNDKS